MIYLLEVKMNDGRRLHPALIRREGDDWRNQLDEAVNYLEGQYAGQGTVDVLFGSDIFTMGASDPDSIPDWRTYREAAG